MIYLVIAVTVIFLLWISTLAIRSTQGNENQSWRNLGRERGKTLSLLQDFIDGERAEVPAVCAPPCDHPDAAKVYSALQKQAPKEALALAEEAMASDATGADARLLLSLVLLGQGDFDAAAAQLQSARKMGAGGAFADYLDSRIELEGYLRNAADGGKGSNNTLLMPIELLALELHVRLGDSGDATALWLPGQGGEISKEEAREFVIAHFTGYYRLIRTILESLHGEESADGIYLLARLALKCGFSEEGAALLSPLEEVMAGSEQHKAYQRDMGLLRGERQVASEASTDDGRKVIKLKVLN
jgi:hypothetical protein